MEVLEAWKKVENQVYSRQKDAGLSPEHTAKLVPEPLAVSVPLLLMLCCVHSIALTRLW